MYLMVSTILPPSITAFKKKSQQYEIGLVHGNNRKERQSDSSTALLTDCCYNVQARRGIGVHSSVCTINFIQRHVYAPLRRRSVQYTLNISMVMVQNFSKCHPCPHQHHHRHNHQFSTLQHFQYGSVFGRCGLTQKRNE